MPKSIIRKLLDENTIEDLKQQHAEELAATNENHARKVEELQTVIDQCREDIDVLKEVADEQNDTLMPLESPSKSLKFVKNNAPLGKKARTVEERKNVMKAIGTLKQQHTRDLAKAAEVYAKRLHTVKKEVEKYKSEAESLRRKASENRNNTDNDDTGVNKKTGVAQRDKENVIIVAPSQKDTKKQSLQYRKKIPQLNDIDATANIPPPSKVDTKVHDLDANNISSQRAVATSRSSGTHSTHEHVKGQSEYDRLFEEDYQFEKNAAYEEIMAKLEKKKPTTNGNNKVIDKLCKDLTNFIEETRSKA